MTFSEQTFFPTSLLWIDSGCIPPEKQFQPFAMTDVLTTYSGQKKQPLIHFWQLSPTMILGMKDTRTPFLKAGIAVLKEQHYQVVVRNAGGLGVMADEGVLNVSLILPNSSTHPCSIDAGYQLMWHWVKQTFPETTIEAYEVSESYCPGQYDLSIKGKKFAGIAQRRVKNGIAIMIYISVTGNQQKRGEIVRQFYQTSLKEAFGTNGYPPVNPASMDNLATLLEQPLTVADVKDRLLKTLTEEFQATLIPASAKPLLTNPWFTHQLAVQIEKMTQRNAQITD